MVPLATGDPYAANVILLVSGAAAAAAVSFPDLSPVANPVTVAGNAKLTTTSPIAGFASSIITDGVGDYATWGTSPPFPANSSPTDANAVWTIEAFVRPTQAGTLLAWGEACT